MERPTRDVEAVRHATRRLLQDLDGLSDVKAAAPSLLPGWTRAEVVTHIARNADGTRRIAECAAHRESGVMYPGGMEARAADIAAGRGARAAVLLADVRRAADSLMDTWRTLSDDAWDIVAHVAHGTRSIGDSVFARWREVELHHVDLALGYTPSDWPVAFVNRVLEWSVTSLPERAERSERSQRNGRRRSPNDALFRIEASDHGRSWTVRLRNGDARVLPDVPGAPPVDGVVNGWGCDLVAWLYGRGDVAETITSTGDDAVLQLASWFPFA